MNVLTEETNTRFVPCVVVVPRKDHVLLSQHFAIRFSV